MNRRASLLIICALLALARSAVAQEPAPADLSFRNVIRSGEPIELTRAWRFHPGDDPAWSAPSFNDTAWEIVEPQMPVGARPKGGWPGVGWFRRHIVVADQVGSNRVQVSIDARGQAEVFVDGVPVVGNGTGGAKSNPSGSWAIVALSNGPHVLAVRYACDCNSERGPIGFRLAADLPGATLSRAATDRREALLFGASVAIPAVLGALHLALFFFYRKARANLFCALCLLSLALIIGVSVGSSGAMTDIASSIFNALMFAGIAGATFFGLMTYAAMRVERIPRTWIPFAIAGALLPIAGPFLGSTGGTIAWSAYFLASLVEMVRISRSESLVRQESATPLLVGMLLLDAAIVAQILVNFQLVPPPFGFPSVYLAGVLAFSLGTSLFVARSFAGTSIHLERRLSEVQALSAQMIATERESARRGIEIEAARALQHSILPLTVPQVPQLEIAARVTTASEVGGDYYDFRVGDDGSVTIAIGDAAGHGVAAGTMVTATKALFSSMAAEESLPAILEKCDRVLRNMNVRPLHMCLLLARVSPRMMSVSSAAMPRPLLYRAATGTVEETVVGGLPLAAGLAPSWAEESAPLAGGDALLFASDGLAEALSPAGDPLGYERVATMFAAVARNSTAGAMVDSLMAEAESWRGSREQNDDIAMVVVRVTQP